MEANTEQPKPQLKVTHSEALGNFAGALALAQGEMDLAEKDRNNPFFNSDYATLSSVINACKGPLAKNGIARVQLPSADVDKVTVTTMLVHKSGEWMRGDLTIKAKSATAQDVGSAITYCKRYGLSAMVGIDKDEDDDGNAATHGAQAATRAEMEQRAKANAKGQAAQPKAGKAETKKEDEKAAAPKVAQTPELRNRIKRFWQAANEYVTKEHAPMFVALALGVSKPSQEWTDADCAKMETALDAEAKKNEGKAAH